VTPAAKPEQNSDLIHLYVKASSGTAAEIELLKDAGTQHFVTSWSRDGRFLLYHTENAPKTGGQDVGKLGHVHENLCPVGFDAPVEWNAREW
jgi:hypothetical protein